MTQKWKKTVCGVPTFCLHPEGRSSLPASLSTAFTVGRGASCEESHRPDATEVFAIGRIAAIHGYVRSVVHRHHRRRHHHAVQQDLRLRLGLPRLDMLRRLRGAGDASKLREAADHRDRRGKQG